MKKIKLVIYSFLAMFGALIAWFLYFLAGCVARFSDAFDQGAEYYHKQVTERT